ncbi:MAG: hypothetical protein P0S96_01455 [Simkaniaceae bacterium]|nr:hypothetical protein [Candidatus Sacchlamyda saccharinae]
MAAVPPPGAPPLPAPATPTSDDELAEEGLATPIPIFSRNETVAPSWTTIATPNGNIKGEALIQATHDAVRASYDEVVDYCCEYEKDIGGPIISPPSTKELVVKIAEPKDWIISLAGWKGMMPSQEIPRYFLFERQPSTKFVGAEIFGNGVTFPLRNHRIHVPTSFMVQGYDVTQSYTKVSSRWQRINKTDLSYNQIIKVINRIKQTCKVTDSDIAKLQLCLLSRQRELPAWATEQDVIQFLDYLNALMFGVEASGLNAALITSLMTLDLIEDGELNYLTAFTANSDGGVYPYATFGNNRGTYNAREQLLHAGAAAEPPSSMRQLRNNPALSPVGIKEAIIIAFWLKHHGMENAIFHESEVLTDMVADCPPDVQQEQRDRLATHGIELIQCAIKDLLFFHFSPNHFRDFRIRKFQPQA